MFGRTILKRAILLNKKESSFPNSKIEGNFKYCLFDGKDYRILSEESLAYKDVESELNDRDR